ncbi:uncharacterized protein LOC127868131 [Dreissena polymorpha]|uniref:Palmitoyltransferase n=1 Tax=Dreissena polymorpha TaxID=45954 RepID=A0A9D4M5X6_DREPO|nr:uncharacterized protein LOC127868131 [Dreissena polymorpha]XP_052265711.1 uncharacterized protein LOC127868131 [Dreissena polymorpha]XP_052265712.1 uncharacterized protein LOC127868131 [Dreissena polymorpha]KAH3869874.1 hypothetical protein DPMN_033047 [Dreissena polymorpha]
MISQNLDFGQEPVDADYQVLIHAVSSCAGESVQQLLRAKPKLVNQKGWHGQTPLHKACLSGDANTVRLLCEFGADPNIQNEFKETAVHYAAKRGIPTLVNILKRYGGLLDVRDMTGKTPVHCAAQTGSVYMLQYFEEQGYNFKDVDGNGQTPLHCACQFGHLEAFKFLVRKGRSDPSVQDAQGDTPLHICVREGYAHGSWLLINFQGLASLHVVNKQGLTPRDICQFYSTSKKEGHRSLLLLMSELSKLPPNGKIGGPVMTWYYYLTMPFLAYAAALLLALGPLHDYQGVVFAVTITFIVRTAMSTSHRINHISRWANPFFAGTFCAGMFHTMLLFYCVIIHSMLDSPVIYVSFIMNVMQLYLYYKLLKTDPGLVTSSISNVETGRPMKLGDLCDQLKSLDQYCGDCEIIHSKTTKHCKLCERCFYRMDHHCLFLLKCVADQNHARFVWFIIFTMLDIVIFLLQCIWWTYLKYANMKYTEIFATMFWKDGWVLSMMFLNCFSVIWACSLLKYQLTVVSRGQTTYFARDMSTLTQTEKFVNLFNFLMGKPLFASDLELDIPYQHKSCDNHKTPIHSV